MLLSQKQFSIYFGGQATSYVDDSLHGHSQQEIMQLPGYKEFCNQNKCGKLVLLEQVHGHKGYSVLDEQGALLKPYSVDADYSITTLKGVALAIETADCVPVILVDPIRGVAAIAHAGWRGAVSGVVPNAAQDMLKYGCLIENMQVYLGPAARACCYEVSTDFKKYGNKETLFERDGRIFFDTIIYILGQLREIGITSGNIVTDYAVCTICSLDYCSFRRQRDLNLRQMTIVALK